METYDTTVREYLRAGHAEVVEGPPLDSSKVYYMPHREVIREHALIKKVQIVFGTSFHEKGCFSLNECLEKGENLYKDLVKVLLRFKMHRVALLAYIEKVFLQILIAEKNGCL